MAGLPQRPFSQCHHILARAIGRTEKRRLGLHEQTCQGRVYSLETPGNPVNREEFETKVLQLWMKSRIPLTKANLQYFTDLSRRKVSSWADDLIKDGVLDIDIDDEGELNFTVPGASRPADGPTGFPEYERKRELVEAAKARILARRAGKTPPKAELEQEPQSRPAKVSEESEDDEDDGEEGPGVASMVGKAALFATGKALVALDKPLSMLDKPQQKGEKSLVLSGGLSLLGPVGWLYAGSFREAIPATAAAAAAYYIVPTFLLAPIMFVGSLASALIGVTYAWQFNSKKGRTPLFLKGRTKKLPKTSSE